MKEIFNKKQKSSRRSIGTTVKDCVSKLSSGGFRKLRTYDSTCEQTINTKHSLSTYLRAYDGNWSWSMTGYESEMDWQTCFLIRQYVWGGVHSCAWDMSTQLVKIFHFSMNLDCMPSVKVPKFHIGFVMMK